MKLIVFAISILFAVPAIAAEKNDIVCQTLEKHKQSDDVAYVAGVDVDGNPVVPADINAVNVLPEDVIKVPLTIDLAKRVNGLTGEDVQMEANMGMIEIHRDGRVMFGDQDWTHNVMALCGQHHVVVDEELVEVPQEEVVPVAEPVVNEKAETSAIPAEALIKTEVSEGKAFQRVSTPELEIIEQPVIEVAPTQAVPPNEDTQMIEGGEYRTEGFND